jgi:hypothetical protein
MLEREDFNEKCEITITFSVDVGDERITSNWEVLGTAADIDGVINDAIADLGRLERSSIPASVERQWKEALTEAEESES